MSISRRRMKASKHPSLDSAPQWPKERMTVRLEHQLVTCTVILVICMSAAIRREQNGTVGR